MNSHSGGLSIEIQSFQTQRPRDVLNILGTTGDGLSGPTAAERYLHDGPNAFTRSGAHWISILARQFFSPLVGLLVAAGVISFFLGETTDGLTVAGILVLNGFLGFIQEYRSAKSTETLADFLRTTASVRRNNAVVSVDRERLVRGDIVLLRAGDAVPADLRIISAENLQIDESTLTGESDAVAKHSNPLPKPTAQIQDSGNLAFSGTLVRHGVGEGVVIATGPRSVIGQIAELVSTTRHASSFEKNIEQFSRFLIKIVAVSLLIVLAVNFLTKNESITFAQQLLFAMALAISVIPEALPAVTTITFSRGALQLAKRHVVVKRLSAIEDLGQIDVLCTDKTGTLTENHPAVGTLIAEDRDRLMQTFLSAVPPTVRAGGRDAGDPFNAAVLTYARQTGIRIPTNDVIDEIPFDPDRRRSTVLIRDQRNQRLIVLGAPENVMNLCSTGFESTSRELIETRIARLGETGERTIAVAVRELDAPITDLANAERNLTFVGAISFVDPVKVSSQRAVLQAEKLGVQVKMITGDSPSVAASVAMKLRLIRSPQAVMTGDQLARLSPAEYDQAARDIRVFARMSPIQKFELIKSLERQKLNVGFLGDGINDAPALKLASVSLVVSTASDVAREAADIVLLDKSLHVIVNGIREGRAIYSNVLKYIKYTLVGNFGNFFAIAGISLITPFLPMLPVQILLTNILTDFPLVAVAGDTVDDKEIRRPPHFRLRELGFLTLMLGLVSSLFDFMFFGIFRQHDPASIQSLWFTASILTELLLIYSIRTTLPITHARTASATLSWLTAGAAVTAVGLPFLNIGQSVFHFVAPSGRSLAIIAVIVIGYFVVTEIVKRLYYRQYRLHPA